jgi:hypothetical protein
MLTPILSTLAQVTTDDSAIRIGDSVVIDFPSSGYAVGYGTLALINAGIAQGKNRSGLNWFLLSLLLGPLATLLLVVFFEKLSFYED